jgi:hypothetical protein
MVKKENSIKCTPIERHHLAEVVQLCKVVNWFSYSENPETTFNHKEWF